MKCLIRNFQNILLLIILIMFLAWEAWAGTTGKITGRVMDAGTGEPLIGVNIYLDGYPYGSATDLDGFFLILNVPPGTYTVVAQMLNYQETRIENVKVNIDLSTRLDFKMNEQALDLGEEITVIAERPLIQKDVTSTSVSVSSDEIRAMPVENYSEVVNLQAGVFDGHFRGGRKGEVTYLIDGIPVNDQFNNSAAVEVENTSIQQLEVISGTFNAEYGQAMSGVVNIVTRDGSNRLESEVSAYVGNYFSNHTTIFPNLGIDQGGTSENLQVTLSGPVPYFRKIKFFLTGRYFNESGNLYGRRLYNIDDAIFFFPSGTGAYVSMDPNKKYSFNGKLTYYLTSTIKLSYSLLWDDNEHKDYDHAYRLAPDGIKTHYRKDWLHSAIINHTLSGTSFHTLKFSQNYSKYDGYVFENPNDPRYVQPEVGTPESGYTFRSGGNQSDRYSRGLTTSIGKYDFVSQVSKEHKIGIGAEFRAHDLTQFYTSFRAKPGAPVDSIHAIVYPDEESAGFERYRKKPFEFNGYIQDKMEYEDFIVNLGVRFEYFDPNTKMPSDSRNPNYLSLFPSGEKQADAKIQISPRLGVAFPISSQGVIHGSYGHFFQIPNFEQLYRGIYDNPDNGKSEFKLVSEQGETGALGVVVGNPDLKPQRTTKYELGLQQGLLPTLVMDLTMYYSDIRNLVQVEILETYDTRKYARFSNSDYANVKGFIFGLEKRFSGGWAATVDYTYQTAKGNNSDPQAVFNDTRDNVEPEKKFIRLDWDQRSTLNFSVTTGKPGNWNLSIIGRIGSNTPYTADRYFNPVDITFRNDRQKPATYSFDLKAEKYINMSGVNLSFFAYIYNLFDRLNEYNVYGSSGRAGVDYNAYISTGEVIGLHTKEDYIRNPTYYSDPRQIRLGMGINY